MAHPYHHALSSVRKWGGIVATSDRGKHNLIKLDWSDHEQLRHLLRRRVINAVKRSHQDAAWTAVNPPMGRTDAVGRMIECSLRRPCFLIDLCERTLSFAINRGHAAVTVQFQRSSV